MITAQGKVEGDCFIVLDAFALPVEGTETRVNAQQEAYEYIIDFAETNKARSACQWESAHWIATWSMMPPQQKSKRPYVCRLPSAC